MTAKERTRILTVCTVPGSLFDKAKRTLWGRPDDSRIVFHCLTEPLLIDGSSPISSQLAPLVREVLQQEYFSESENADSICNALSALVGPDATTDIIQFACLRWQYIHTQEAIDRAKAWTEDRDIFAEIDHISPDPLYSYFHKATKTIEEANAAVFLYGYEMGLAEAKKGGKA